jgi:hypothetical protein
MLEFEGAILDLISVNLAAIISYARPGQPLLPFKPFQYPGERLSRYLLAQKLTPKLLCPCWNTIQIPGAN